MTSNRIATHSSDVIRGDVTKLYQNSIEHLQVSILKWPRSFTKKKIPINAPKTKNHGFLDEDLAHVIPNDQLYKSVSSLVY